ncbi:MAG: glycerophosphodiester phosphodiesterase [Nocardioides sp.]
MARALAAPRTALDELPVVIAHRGASGYRPEHTLGAYRLAVALGADYLEPDLVSTRDGVLVARHENNIAGTTDVADHPEYAERRTTRTVDGREVTGWFTEDFTLAELRTLRAVERLPDVRPRNARYNGHYAVPTFDEVLALAASESRRTGRRIGVYPETKHPTHFADLGLALEEPLLAALGRHGLDRPGSRVFLQSFETGNLRRLRELTHLPLVQLVDSQGAPRDRAAAGPTYAAMATPAGLREVASYVDAVGVHKDLVLPRVPGSDALGGPTSLVQYAHDAGLAVHVWTLRAENRFLPADLRSGDDPAARGAAAEEVRRFLDAGVDGVFSDHADTAVAARRLWVEANRDSA